MAAETPADAEAGTARQVIELDEAPSLTRLFASIALPRLPWQGGADVDEGTGDGALPDVEVVLRGVTPDMAHVAAYNDVCGFSMRNTLPVTYPHMLGFPLSVKLMTRSDFPFKLLGMVHVANRIIQHRPIGVAETLDVRATVENLRPHPKGQQMDNIVTASVGDEVVWESVSTYLKRGSGASEDATAGAAAQATEHVDLAEMPLTSKWIVPDDIGRHYGAVSGDRNPIHISAMSAKAFGFPRAIAHGMWTKARCLAALEGRLPEKMTVDVAFKLPVLLPAKVEYVTQQGAEGGWTFGVRGRDGKPHVVGAVAGA